VLRHAPGYLEVYWFFYGRGNTVTSSSEKRFSGNIEFNTIKIYSVIQGLKEVRTSNKRRVADKIYR